MSGRTTHLNAESAETAESHRIEHDGADADTFSWIPELEISVSSVSSVVESGHFAVESFSKGSERV